MPETVLKPFPVTPVTQKQDAISSHSKLIGLTALRGWAAVAVVILHACMPYSRPMMPGLVWSVTDTPSQTATVLMWSIEVVIMPVFLVIAGFLAAQSMGRRGPSETMKTRLRRLGWPLLWTTLFLVPVELYIWLAGMLSDGLIAPRKLRTLKFDDVLDAKLWGLSHLWFLQYLMTYVILLAIGWRTLRKTSDRTLRRFALPVCFAIAVVTLAFRPEVVWGFQHAFLPVPSKWIYSAVFFLAGAMWWRLDPHLQVLSVHSKRMIGPSLMLWIASVSIGLWWLTRDGFSVNSSWINQTALSMVTVIAAVCVTFTAIGFSIGNIRHLGPLTGRLAGASFLIYLLHHPVVGLAHITAKYASPNLPVAIKVTGVTFLGVGAGLAVDYLWACRCERIQSRLASTDDGATLPFEKHQSTWRSEEKQGSRAA